MKRAAVAALLALVAARAESVPVQSEGPLRFESHFLELPGKIELTHFDDIDRDGRHDVLAVYALEGALEAARNLVVYFQRDDGFSATPDLTLRLDDDVSLIDVGEVDPTLPGQELLMLASGELRCRSITPAPGPVRVLFHCNPVFARSEALAVAKRDFARQAEGDSLATIYLPDSDGYEIYYPDDRYARPVHYGAQHDHRVSENSYLVRPAELHFADFDGDGTEDLAFTHLDRVRVHRKIDGRFELENFLDLDLQILTATDRQAPEDLSRLVGFSIDDFDGDGLADLFVRKVVVQKKAVVNDKQQFQLYRNKGGRFELLPDQAFVLKSFDVPELLDLNGDGRKDIVTGYFEFNLTNIVKALLSKRFQIDLSFFLFGDEGFSDRPNAERSFKLHISLSNMDENFAPAVEMEGDYDGDGRLDFLMQTDDEKVEIALGKEGDQLFEKDASVKLKVFASNEAFVDDLNGDGRSDLVFYDFPDREPFNQRWIHLVLSK